MTVLRISVLGRVQGVGFRAYVCDLAIDREIVGEVWNSRERTVEIIAGHLSDEILYDFVAALKLGPGRVESVDAHLTAENPGKCFDISFTR